MVAEIQWGCTDLQKQEVGAKYVTEGRSNFWRKAGRANRHGKQTASEVALAPQLEKMSHQVLFQAAERSLRDS